MTFAPRANPRPHNDFRRHPPIIAAGVLVASCFTEPQRMALTQNTEDAVTVKITPNDKGNPPGKLAEAELHFQEGPLAGLKMVGFAVWERRSGNGRNVTFPARSYTVNGERRTYALLRPITDATAQDQVRDLILQAYADHEEQAAIAS